MIPFPLTLRLDDTDSRVFERAAQPGEWAIPGSFVFVNRDLDTLTGKARQAFVHGFLGLRSFGWSTLVEVGEISEEEFDTIINALALHFVARYGAPDVAAALPVAKEEAEFASGLCQYRPHTMLAMERSVGPDGIVERFKVIRPSARSGLAPVWDITAEDDEQ